ncbi:substrate-binding domain-containing protein [Streptomyces sp. WI03-4A]|uniref:substrate-binding domain-containing protein n=1 Tax=Streptomyces sp. WI03-4A TaxID=3028706 RepID=UPI0029A78B64|nr:substrate-binding domain-containing protein [Streptomyces sp. WI03-4A]MDX2596568.1 substrate-binding domain-containing protein [Streptomyces sp. WI03-4A]
MTQGNAEVGQGTTAGLRRYSTRPAAPPRATHCSTSVRGPRPTAVFAVNDTAAIGVIGALREHGLRPGDDVAVMGSNDIPVAADMPVPLSTVRSPVSEMGRQAMCLLIDRLQGRQVRSKRLRPRLIARASTLGE